jgi:hypothetical protein
MSSFSINTFYFPFVCWRLFGIVVVVVRWHCNCEITLTDRSCVTKYNNFANYILKNIFYCIFLDKCIIKWTEKTSFSRLCKEQRSGRIVKNKQECLFQNRNFRYLFVCLVYLFVLFFMTKEVSAGSTFTFTFISTLFQCIHFF